MLSKYLPSENSKVPRPFLNSRNTGLNHSCGTYLYRFLCRWQLLPDYELPEDGGLGHGLARGAHSCPLCNTLYSLQSPHG